MDREVLATPGVYESRGYSQAIKVGDTLYIAGIVGKDADGNIDEDSAGAQAEQIWVNMERILRHAGGELNDLVQITTYITRKDDHDAVRSARHRHYVGDPQPTATLVVCSALATPDLLVEINAIAVIGKK